jgi:hypothetical protein
MPCFIYYILVAAGMAPCITATIRMSLLIFSDMPTFTAVLNSKQMSWHTAVKPVLAL